MVILDWYNPAIRKKNPQFNKSKNSHRSSRSQTLKTTEFSRTFFPLKFLNRFELFSTTIYINPLSTRLRVGWVNNQKTRQFQTRSMWMVKAMCFSSAEASMSLNSSNSAPATTDASDRIHRKKNIATNAVSSVGTPIQNGIQLKHVILHCGKYNLY